MKKSKNLSFLKFILLASGLVLLFNFYGFQTIEAQSQNLLLWNGETSNISNLTFYYGSANNSKAYRGTWAFEGRPDPWHAPGTSLSGLSSWRADLSGYDEIWFYAKADVSGKTFDFSIYGWPYQSKSVNIDSYIVGGGGLNTSYKLVKIPIQLLKTTSYSLNKVEILYFGTAKPTSGHKIYIDEIYAVKLTTTPTPTPTPPPAGALSASVTNITSSTVSLTWENIANASQVRVYIASEPASVPGGSLPYQTLAVMLPGGTTSYQLTKLAAASDTFIRIEVIIPTGKVSNNLHARTLGGPRVVLDTPVREVQGYAPNILKIVLENKAVVYNGTGLTGNQGPAWQAGPWTITRRNGNPILVQQVYRHSFPVGQPNYQIGWGPLYENAVLDIDHSIYLALSEAVGSQDLLRIRGPFNLDFTLPFSDRYLETSVIQLNQVGYHPRATKRWAYISGWMGNGGPLSLASFPTTAQILTEPSDDNLPRAITANNLPITLRASMDSDAGADVREINLAAVPPAEGVTYRVRIPGVGVSWPTAISQASVFKAFHTITRGLFHNRWGGDLQPAYTNWSRPVDHPTVYTAEGTDPNQFYPSDTPKTGQRPLAGGYHDASDFDQRPMHVVVAQLLMRAFELKPDAFTNGQLNIPESANGIPDLLDEALWGVKGWEQLQEADGGVRLGVESWSHPLGYYHAHVDPLPYWTFAREANHTARVAGLFAQAARLVAPYDANRSNTLKTRAINAYNYAVAYGAANSNLLYASGELFRLTGSIMYKTAFENAWAAIGPYGAFSNLALSQFYLGDYFNNNRVMPDYILGYLGRPDANADIRSTSELWLTQYADEAVNNVLNSPHAHRNPRPANSNTYWGLDTINWGYGTTMGRFMDTIYARLQLGGLSASTIQGYLDALSLSVDYVLGGNPNGLVYFTGLGSRQVEESLHLDTLTFIKEGKGSIPGIPVYGPVEDLPTDDYYGPGKAAFYPAFAQQPRLRRYGDLRTFAVTNDFSVWESQAPHAEHFAVLLGLGM